MTVLHAYRRFRAGIELLDDFFQHTCPDVPGLLRLRLLRHYQGAGNYGRRQVLISPGLKVGLYRMRHSAAARFCITLLGDFGYHF